MYCPPKAWAVEHNWRGWKDDQLIYRLQKARDTLDDITACPWVFKPQASDLSHGEYIYHLKAICQDEIDSIEKEFARRDKIASDYRPADPRILETIKSKLSIDEVIAEYTQVHYNGNTIKYNCTLHGTDTDPSGMIYKDQQKAWCFGCNTGGDIFDMVQLFERITLREAINKLARKIGLDTKPIKKDTWDRF